ncbi:MAG: DPP IV N-terminal domain-containing protein [Woeseiaceae bacterium]|nr:DPP IV N-terminal domain-containing protein [Woeseiaceae bacterium]
MIARAMLFGLLAWSAGALAAPKALQNTDVFDLEIAADPRVSPDGETVAYVRRSMDIMTDSTRASVWLVDSDGGNHRPLLSGTDSYNSPRWSPDGERIAFVATAEGRGPELWVRWVNSGQTALLTNLPAAPQDIAWSPTGDELAFSMHVAGEAPTLASPPKSPKAPSGRRR